MDALVHERRQRPGAVTVVALLAALQGVWNMLVAGLIFVVDTSTKGSQQVMTAILIAGGMSVVMGLAAGALAWGLWRLQRWAFLGTIGFECVVLTLALCTLVTGGAANVALLVMLAFAASIFGTLLGSRTVREAFQPVIAEEAAAPSEGEQG
jgi:hypothetical protein